MTMVTLPVCDGCDKRGREPREVRFMAGWLDLAGHACSTCLPELSEILETTHTGKGYDFYRDLDVHNELKAKIFCHLIGLKAPKNSTLVVADGADVEIWTSPTAAPKKLYMKLLGIVAEKLIKLENR